VKPALRLAFRHLLRLLSGASVLARERVVVGPRVLGQANFPRETGLRRPCVPGFGGVASV